MGNELGCAAQRDYSTEEIERSKSRNAHRGRRFQLNMRKKESIAQARKGRKGRKKSLNVAADEEEDWKEFGRHRSSAPPTPQEYRAYLKKAEEDISLMRATEERRRGATPSGLHHTKSGRDLFEKGMQEIEDEVGEELAQRTTAVLISGADAYDVADEEVAKDIAVYNVPSRVSAPPSAASDESRGGDSVGRMLLAKPRPCSREESTRRHIDRVTKLPPSKYEQERRDRELIMKKISQLSPQRQKKELAGRKLHLQAVGDGDDADAVSTKARASRARVALMVVDGM